MKYNKIIFIVSAIFAFAAVFYRFTYSFFNDASTSSTNTFTASAVFPTGITPTSTTTPTPTGTASPQVVINEINWGGSNVGGAAGDADEWVELKNTTSSPIDIGNLVVVNLGPSVGNTITIPSGSTIPANGFFLISHYSNSAPQSALNVTPDYIIGNDMNLENTGEQLTLKTNSTGTTIDTANGTSTWFAGTNTNPIKSMERTDPPGDGTVSTNWQTATTHTGMDGSSGTDEFGTPKNTNP